jgi:hypothetical protein
MQRRLNREIFEDILAQIPEDWLPGDRRILYSDLLSRRLNASSKFVEEAIRARTQLV